MTVPLQLASTDRVLVFAPHPDDETLAAGELIQLAIARGAGVRVVFATDGENNPWPQRWLERRWRIGAADRARWAVRRRGEAAAALRALGLDPAVDARFLGWPDQGLTDVLMHDGCGVETLAAEICSFAPTHVVIPARGDRHPDHSALHVMLQLAIRDAGIDCVRLYFLVHGERGGAHALVLPPEPARRQRKRAALEAHASQVALSRRRLCQLADRPEAFELDASPRPSDTKAPLLVRIPLRAGWPARGRHELLLVHGSGSAAFRCRAKLPRRPGATMTLFDAQGRVLQGRWIARTMELELPPLSSATATFAKIHRSGARLVIYDRECWLDAVDRTSAIATPSVEPAVTGAA
jgi:LmbE family N-acetylglucosaminyl deacetylase